MSRDSKPRGAKPPLHIVPMQFVWNAARALQHGLSKEKGYVRDSWMHAGPEADEYLGSCMRHITAILDGEELDEEGRPHIEGACASLAIFAWHWSKGFRVKRPWPQTVVVDEQVERSQNGSGNVAHLRVRQPDEVEGAQRG
jgi:hypothetical protein